MPDHPRGLGKKRVRAFQTVRGGDLAVRRHGAHAQPAFGVGGYAPERFDVAEADQRGRHHKVRVHHRNKRRAARETARLLVSSQQRNRLVDR